MTVRTIGADDPQRILQACVGIMEARMKEHEIERLLRFGSPEEE